MKGSYRSVRAVCTVSPVKDGRGRAAIRPGWMFTSPLPYRTASPLHSSLPSSNTQRNNGLVTTRQQSPRRKPQEHGGHRWHLTDRWAEPAEAAPLTSSRRGEMEPRRRFLSHPPVSRFVEAGVVAQKGKPPKHTVNAPCHFL